MSIYRIRAATQRDVPQLPDIELRAASLLPVEDLPPDMREYSTPVSDFEAAAAAGQLWVAVAADDAPVGFALTRRVDGATHLHELDVHPDHGRKGIGRRLVERVFDQARRRSDPAVTLTTFAHIPFNAPFYARLGFRVVPAADIGPELRAIVAEETEEGLDPDKRVVMRRPLDGDD